jgi:orotidine-5'-phosphate decarboxylase
LTLDPRPRDRLIVALDLPTVEEAETIIARLGAHVVFYKIGLELAYAGGLELARRLIGAGKQVFLDLKLHDIPHTVERAAAQIGRLGATFLTIHAFPATMRAAREGLRDSQTGLLAVTVLTSFDSADLLEAGYGLSLAALVERRSLQAQAAGVDGLVLAAAEVGSVRALVGPTMLLVTPGIRPRGSETGDQKRVMTAGEARRAGADYLVVGRPITRAQDPAAIAEMMLAEIAEPGRIGR